MQEVKDENFSFSPQSGEALMQTFSFFSTSFVSGRIFFIRHYHLLTGERRARKFVGGNKEIFIYCSFMV